MLKYIPKNTFFNATDLIEELIKNDLKVISFPFSGYWMDVGKHEDFEKAQLDTNNINFQMNILITICARGGSKGIPGKKMLICK